MQYSRSVSTERYDLGEIRVGYYYQNYVNLLGSQCISTLKGFRIFAKSPLAAKLNFARSSSCGFAQSDDRQPVER